MEMVQQKKINYLLVFGFLFFSCKNKNSIKDFDEFVHSAIKHVESNQDNIALEEINNAINLDSTKSFAFVLRGRIYITLNRDKEGISDFTKAIAINPGNTAAYFYRGVAYSIEDEDLKAISDFDSALITKTYGSIIYEVKNSELLDFENQLDVPEPKIRYSRGISYYHAYQYDKAVNDFVFCIDNKYDLMNSEFYAGVILLTKDKSRGCEFLKNAKDKGNEKARLYIDKYCH